MIRILWWLLFGSAPEPEREYHECDWSVWSFPAPADWKIDNGSIVPGIATQSRACVECGEVQVRWIKAWSPALADELRKLSPSLMEEVINGDRQCHR